MWIVLDRTSKADPTIQCTLFPKISAYNPVLHGHGVQYMSSFCCIYLAQKPDIYRWFCSSFIICVDSDYVWPSVQCTAYSVQSRISSNNLDCTCTVFSAVPPKANNLNSCTFCVNLHSLRWKYITLCGSFLAISHED